MHRIQSWRTTQRYCEGGLRDQRRDRIADSSEESVHKGLFQRTAGVCRYQGQQPNQEARAKSRTTSLVYLLSSYKNTLVSSVKNGTRNPLP